jgi:hypothetical protein
VEQKTEAQTRKGRWKLFAVLFVCASPLLASYFTYYVIKPEGRTNYGALIDPRQHPIPDLKAVALDGKPAGLDAWKGKWIMLRVGPSECAKACQDQIFFMRQLRIMQGKEQDRVERVWLATDNGPLDIPLLKQFDGMHVLRVDAETVRKWLPLEPGMQLEEHIFMIDPLGNLMMRFPKDPDPSKVKKDVSKLLKASAIG